VVWVSLSGVTLAYVFYSSVRLHYEQWESYARLYYVYKKLITDGRDKKTRKQLKMRMEEMVEDDGNGNTEWLLDKDGDEVGIARLVSRPSKQD
jgi:hypothetical protein